nr:MAG TPA: hypothetical protein [Caudoviricetes sp.]
MSSRGGRREGRHGCFRGVSGVHVWVGCCEARRLAPVVFCARGCVCCRSAAPSNRCSMT